MKDIIKSIRELKKGKIYWIQMESVPFKMVDRLVKKLEKEGILAVIADNRMYIRNIPDGYEVKKKEK